MTEANKQLVNTLSEENSRLDQLSKFIVESFIEAGSGKTELSEKWLVDLLQGYNFPETRPTDIWGAFDKFIETRKLSISRKRHYLVLRRALQRFSLFQGIDLNFDNLDSDTLRDFENFLSVEHEFATRERGKDGKERIKFLNAKYEEAFKQVPESRLASPRGENYLIDLMTKLRTFSLWFKENGYSNNDPFRDYEIGTCIYGTPFYLTIEERNKLFSYDFSKDPSLAVSRDIFVFQCVVGCRLSDLKKFTKSSIIDGALEYIPRKTKGDRAVIVRVPLNSIAREILDRFKDTPGDQLLPFPRYDSYYNEDIKTMCYRAGLDRVVTTLNPTTREEEKHPLWEVASSHIARRCFIGNLYKQVKDPNLVGKLSGHKEGSRAFARYRDIDEEMTRDLVKLLEN